MSLSIPTKHPFLRHPPRGLAALTPLPALAACGLLLGLTACQEVIVPPNLLLIALERTRVDHLGVYGKEPSPTRLYDYLAGRGLAFTNAYTSNPRGAEAAIDLLSGGNVENSGLLLPEILQREGYVTIGSLNEQGATDQRLKAGFDDVDDAGGTHEERSDRLFNLVTSHTLDEKPIFVFYQAPLIEAPYSSASKRTEGGERVSPDVDFERLKKLLASGEKLKDADAAQLADLYAMEVSRAHDAVFTLMRPLRGWGFYERYITVITALRGEELGEHGLYSPEDSLHNEVLHIPLIIATDTMIDGSQSADLVTIRDIAPTMLGYAGITAPNGMSGRNLLSPQRTPLEAVHSRTGDASAVTTAEWKLIESADGGTVRLYNRVDDPRELTDVSAKNPQVVEQLRAK